MTERKDRVSAGFTLVELMIVVAIMATLAGISIPYYFRYIEMVRTKTVILDIRMIEKEITLFVMANDRYPNDLAEIGLDTLLDIWGNPYRYLPVEGTPEGKL